MTAIWLPSDWDKKYVVVVVVVGRVGCGSKVEGLWVRVRRVMKVTPISGNVINQSLIINQTLYLQTPGNNSRHVDNI